MRKLEYNIEILVPRFPWRALPMFYIKFNLSSSEVSTFFIFTYSSSTKLIKQAPLHSTPPLHWTHENLHPQKQNTHTHTEAHKQEELTQKTKITIPANLPKII